MRLSLSRPLSLATFVAGVVVAGVAHAQSFGAAVWLPLQRFGFVVGDVVGPGTNETDIVGDPANPAAFVWSDSAYLYLRMRVNDKPTASNGSFMSSSWGCLVDTDGTLTSYEFMAVLAGQAGEVQWRYNAVQDVGANVPNEPAEVLAGSSLVSTNGRALDALSGAPFSGNADWFVDLAVPWATVRGGLNGAPAVVAGTPMRFACGTSTSGFHIGTDQATTDAAGALSGTWSDPYVCGNTGCVLDTDGDGVPDAVETTLGTNSVKADTDGDGIPDNVELSAGAGPYGPFTAPDTDLDGTKDVFDLDSDNDCRTDALEGAGTFRNALLPNANASANCSGATPFCVKATATCIACDASLGGAGTSACPFSAAPACQLAGALAGRCTACKVGETAVCSSAASVATPACEVTTGACTACNGDNGAATTAVCTSALLPVCNLAGGLAGRCTQCTRAKTALCTNATPACDALLGTCAPCNGDRGGGATHSCPNAASPYCALTGANLGECGKCTSNADCVGVHTGPTCDLPSGACIDVDTDGDGVNDSVERLLGTDRMKKDTDGDGIGDLAEVTPPGGGATDKVDSDSDGIIDALDKDSDNDGVADSAEGTADLDADGLGNFRDADDDGDGISTATEVADALAARRGDDIDADGLKNYYDTDADGDGKSDLLEGRGDSNNDGIPDYLDGEPVVLDAGTDAAPPIVMDAGTPPVAGAAPDQGVIEGTGLLCAVSHVSGRRGASWAVIVGLLGIALAAFVRARRPARRS